MFAAISGTEVLSALYVECGCEVVFITYKKTYHTQNTSNIVALNIVVVCTFNIGNRQ